MKKIFKRFRLSEWLLLLQILLSGVTLLLATYLGDTIIDIIGLLGNIVNGIILIVVFFLENSKNVKYHELTGQFIFNKVGESFAAFMDFLMSDEYAKSDQDERNLLSAQLVKMAGEGDYDTKRKLARALPYLYDIDSKTTLEIMALLRKDIHNDRTDIRRRTIEAALTIIQRQPSPKKKRRCAKRFFPLFSYHKYDDGYTAVACIEGYYFLCAFVFKSDRRKRQCLEAFATLKQAVTRAHEMQIGGIEDAIIGDMDNIWDVLSSLSAMQDINRSDCASCRARIDDTLVNGAKFSKLSVVKNLYYTCEGFPECLSGHKCTAMGSKYMMDRIHRFLTSALDNDVFLAMPTVRYFDCVCNNVCKGDSKAVARTIISEYFSSDELLITQTAFDKFAKLLKEDNTFARSVILDMINKESEHAARQSADILSRLAALPQKERALFTVETARTKFKSMLSPSYRPLEEGELSAEAKAVDLLIDSYNDRIRFIGKIKKFKEDHNI